MSLGQTQYVYTVELAALEENMTRSKDRVLRLHEKAMKRNDLRVAQEIDRLQRSLDTARRQINRLM